jgi:hypothetical protein
VDKDPGKGIWGYFSGGFIKTLVTVSKNLGIVAYFVDAKDDNAVSFYQRFGFIPLPDSPYELFLPLPTIEAAFS